MKIEIEKWFDDVLGVKRYHVFIDDENIHVYEALTTIDERSTSHGKWRFEHFEGGTWQHESPYFENKRELFKHIKEYHEKNISRTKDKSAAQLHYNS